MGFAEGLEHVVRENEPLAPYTRLRIGGPAEFFAEPTSVEELAELVRRARSEDLPIRLLGGGTNLLVRDEGVPGVVISLAAPAFCHLETTADGLRSGGGTKLTHLIATAVREGFAGPEQLVGIPGTVGGALHANSGTHGGDIGQWCRSATVLTRGGEVVRREADDLSFSYRQSSLNELVILSADFVFEREPSETLTRRMQKLWIVKQSRQPSVGERSAYVFRDPVGVTATSLIEQVGLKGTKVGAVELCERDPNFVVANDRATSSDVLRLIDLVRSRVEDGTGIELTQNLQVW
ncbi:MAG TPA: UDP-N-acetylenolpyruvoylglucosamine reductase [Planctomycetaceae bacterium]|nr:UDP-N-acetylenolpyruvoylglucosamine reductase [Planctomycetaceae bacterium]HRF00603.1 UDP-N-acetylmuramate dehydrogenase [Pirellulaceae bacterium]